VYIGIDQYGQKTLLQTLSYKSIKAAYYCGKIKKMYQDTKDGESFQTGYVLGMGNGNQALWVRFYKLENPFSNRADQGGN
jgi:hypothetical protein